MASITNKGQILSHLELPSSASSSSTTSIRRNQIRFGNPKKKFSIKNIAIASVSVGLAHTIYKSRNSFLSTGGGNGGSGTNGGFGGDGGGGGGGGPFSGELFSLLPNSEEKNKSHEIAEVELKNKHGSLKDILSGICIRACSKTIPTKAQLESDIKRAYLEMHLEKDKFNLEGTTIGLRLIIPEEHMCDSLFPKIQSDTRWDKKNGGLTYMQQSDDLKTECSIVTGCGGPLTLASLEPGGAMSFEHRNIHGNASIISSVAFSELLHPQDDINCNVNYVHPDFRGHFFRSSAYKTIKLCPALPTGADLVHPTWVDKVGIKANITENFTPQTNFTYGMVLEEITAHNRSNGQMLSDGTPTTPSGGNQRLYGQVTLARDNTKFVNGAIVGDKIEFQIDQSPGLCGRLPIFNRHQLTMTTFHQLKETEEGVEKPSPPVLVLHAHYGGYAGDLFPLDTFTLGGPDSVRGYNVGEIGAARNILEVAAEVRVPVRNTQVYAFAEHGSDLGSSMGNPTEGHGSSYGVGAKLGFVRVEYAINHNSHTGELSVRFGERF